MLIISKTQRAVRRHDTPSYGRTVRSVCDAIKPPLLFYQTEQTHTAPHHPACRPNRLAKSCVAKAGSAAGGRGATKLTSFSCTW